MKWLLLLPVLLIGCTRVEYVTVKVPVPVPCPEPPAKRPLKLPIHDLPLDATNEMKAKAIAATIKYLMGRWEESETLLDGYRSSNGRTNSNSSN